jgi:uncharacterized membrane protein
VSAEPPVSPPPAAAPQAAAPASNRTIMIVLSYLGLLALVPFILEKDDKEVKWHARHGLVLMVAEIVLFVGLGILSIVLSVVTKGLAALLFTLLFPLLGLGLLVFHIMCIVKGINGQRLTIPTGSAYADKF